MNLLLAEDGWTRSDWGVGIILGVGAITAILAFMTWWGYRKDERRRTRS